MFYVSGGNYSGHSDTTWSKKSIARVANEIKKLCSNNEVSTPDSASLLDVRCSFCISFLKNAMQTYYLISKVNKINNQLD